MKRLTKKDFNICNVCDRGPLGTDWSCDGSPACRDKAAYDRLAAIEDILGDGDDYELDRLRELVEADREGRCVVLPRLEPGQGDNPGEPGVPGPPGIATESVLKAREQE